MALFGLFGKKAKINLTPDVNPPNQEDLFFTTKLRDLASRRIAGNDLGFGPEFLDKATNPTIQGIERNFSQNTLPRLSSQLSARGVNRSIGPGLATDVLSRAEGDKNQGISELLSQFYTLNETQKKADFGQALDLSKGLQDQQASMLNNKALASERLSQRTQDQANTNAAVDRDTASKVLSMISSVVGGPIGAMATGGFKSNPIVANVMGQPISNSQTIQGGLNAIASQTLDSYSANRLDQSALLKLLMQIYGV